MSSQWDEPMMMVRCECGELYTLHMHTVCPRCFKWPTPEEKIPDEKPLQIPLEGTVN
jgi:NMD protein affecting ribosome stability and mRNA decay